MRSCASPSAADIIAVRALLVHALNGGAAVLHAVRLRAVARASAAPDAADEGSPGFRVAPLNRVHGHQRAALVKCSAMLRTEERAEIDRLWARKVQQDAQGLPQPERHRNLEPSSAEFIHALAAGMEAKRILEIGGSSGVSTIALAAAARLTGGRLISIEREPVRQADARQTIARLGLDKSVEFVLGDAGAAIPNEAGLDFALIDCE